MKYARIINDTAVDVVSIDPAQAFTPEIAAQFVEVPDAVDPGWMRLPRIVGTAMASGKAWRPPRTFIEEYLPGAFRYARHPAPASADFVPAVRSRRIKPIAYRNRFRPHEKVAIELFAAHDPAASTQDKQKAAALRAAMADVAVAPFIDLDDDRPMVGVRARTLALETDGVIGPGRALEILDAPVRPNEVA